MKNPRFLLKWPPDFFAISQTLRRPLFVLSSLGQYHQNHTTGVSLFGSCPGNREVHFRISHPSETTNGRCQYFLLLHELCNLRGAVVESHNIIAPGCNFTHRRYQVCCIISKCFTKHIQRRWALVSRIRTLK